MHPSEAWRLLELPSAPTVEQVKAAYRRMAKALHPDLSREHADAAEPARFARLTVAYETALAEAVAANRRGAGATKREQAPLHRVRRAPVRWRVQDDVPPDDAPSGRTRATPGSTTYPDKPYEGDPEWDGAGWVGESSGTYWTVNPKEYADPRRHGPEYRARGRRPVHRRASERREDGEQRVAGEMRETIERPSGIARIAGRIAALFRRQGTIRK